MFSSSASHATQWDSTFLMIHQLLHLKEHVDTVAEELSWETLSSAQWKQLESIHVLIQPFSHHTYITSADETTTIGMVIPILTKLELN